MALNTPDLWQMLVPLDEGLIVGLLLQLPR